MKHFLTTQSTPKLTSALALSALVIGTAAYLLTGTLAISTTNSVTSGSWSDPTTWDGEVPGSSDQAVISSGHEVTYDQTDSRVSGVTVQPDATLTFAPDTTTTLETDRNVIVEGNLVMKPNSADIYHTLKFVGVDETAMVGGGMEVLDTDVGLWVVENGQLDLQGTERTGWNRTGNDPTWRDGDEIRQAPIEKGVTQEFPAFTPGSQVPSVTAPDGSVHKTEIMNLTRNVRIHGGGTNPGGEVLDDDGRAHVIILACNQPQTIKHTEFRWLGPREPNDRDDTDGRIGRYGLHFHHCEDGSRGSEVEGVVARDLGNSAFVPHVSHGVTFTDTISFDTYESAYWWDPGDETHDVIYDRAAALLTRDYPAYRGYSLDGFRLGRGINMTVRESVAVGTQGKSVNSGGFHWPGKAGGGPEKNNTWTFENNVAHNNKHNGLSAWQNDANDHIVTDYVGYRNGKAGINHGSYRNRYHYRDSLVFDNEHGIIQHALSSDEQIVFSNLDVGSVVIASHSLASDNPVIYDNVRVRSDVRVAEDDAKAGIFEFRYDCNNTDHMLTKDDFDLVTPLSDIYIVDECAGEFTTVHDGGVAGDDYFADLEPSDPDPSDTTDPTVSLTNPSGGDTVSGTQTVTVEASDDTGVSQVEFSVDGSPVATDSSAPYEFDWDTTNGGDHPCNGPHTHDITATATDTSGNTATDTITVNMDDPDYCDSSDPLTGDLNGDGAVDILDLSTLLSTWGSSDPAPPEADINGDGSVGIQDLSALLSNWTG